MDIGIQDYAYKIQKETEKTRKKALLVIALTAIFFFSFGAYFAFSSMKEENNQLDKFNLVYQTILDEWYYGVDEENLDQTLITNAIKGILDNDNDLFTRYVTSIDYLQDSSIGIGISLMEYKEYFYINDVLSSHSVDSDLRVGDIIKTIDGVDLAYKSISELSSLISNKSSVTFLIERNNEEIERTVQVQVYNTLTVFNNPSLHENINYVRISEFGNNTADELSSILENNAKEKIIIDLRDNPGGYIESVVKVADLFLAKDKVVLETRDNKNNSIFYRTKNDLKYDFEDIIIMINSNSASGSEALSAALNEHLGDKVTLVGEKTYGKGSAQKTISLGDGTYLSYTYALWYTPNGNSIHHEGVQSEVEYLHNRPFELSLSYVELQEDDLGDEVKFLQSVLAKLGYHEGEWEYFGYYSNETIDALKDYQFDNNIEQTGIFDLTTRRYMMATMRDDKNEGYLEEIDFCINMLLQ